MKGLSVVGTCVLVLTLAASMSCQKNNPAEKVALKSTDDANYLQTQLVFLDERGQIDGYMVGMGLNEADPGEVSIHCETLEQARTLFESWIPQDASAFRSGESVIWEMTDTLGVSQGRAVLAPGGEKGAVAHLELPSGFPGVTSVLFLPQASMPENSELDVDSKLEEYYFLNTVFYGGNTSKDFHGSGEFVVIREYDQDTNTSGIILYCHKTEWNSWKMSSNEKRGVESRCRTLSELRIVGKVYREFMTEIDKELKRIGENGNNKFFCLESKSSDGWGNAKRYNLRDWEPETVNAFQPTFHEAWVYFFTFEKKGDGYKLVFK